MSFNFASGDKVVGSPAPLATDYVDTWTAMVTSVEFLDNVIEGLKILIVFVNVLSMLFHKDEILGCLPHCFDGLFALFTIEVD